MPTSTCEKYHAASRWSNRILLGVTILVLLALVVIQTGCGAVGPNGKFVRQEIDPVTGQPLMFTTDINHPASTYISTPEPGGLAFVGGVGVGNRSQLSLNAEDGTPITTVNDTSVGGTNSVVAIPFPGSGKYALARLGDNGTLAIDGLTIGDTAITGLRVTRDPATATLAANAALKDWNDVAKSFTEAEKEAFIAQIKAVENVSSASIKAALKLLFPPAAAASTATEAASAAVDSLTE